MGTAAGSRARLSWWQMNITHPCPAFPPSLYQHGQWLVASAGHLCLTRSENSKPAQKGRQLWDHSASPPPSLSVRLSPDAAEGQVVAAMVALPGHPQKTDQPPARWHQRALCAGFGHLRSTLSMRSAATVAPKISAQSPCFAIHVGSPTAVSLFPRGGAQPQQLVLPASTLFAFPQHHSGCGPSLPTGPLSHRLPNPTLWKPGSQNILVLRLTGCKIVAVHHTMHTMRNVY